MNLVIYTTNFGDYDVLTAPKIVNKNVKYVCFTDRELECYPWEIRVVKPEFEDLRRENRKYKILSHKFFGEYEYSIYIDACFTIMTDLSQYVEEWLGKNDIAVMNHPLRNCIYEEAKKCIKLDKDDKKIIKKQIIKYKEDNYPQNNGLTVNGFIIRRHTEEIEKFNEMWWNEVKNFSVRDQLSYCYIINKLNMDYSIIQMPSPLFGYSQYIRINSRVEIPKKITYINPIKFVKIMISNYKFKKSKKKYDKTYLKSI